MSALVDRMIARNDVRQLIMVEIDHPEGMGRFVLGLGIYEYGGNNYYGVGVLGSISEVTSTSEIEIVETSFNLSGVDPDLLAGLDDSVKGRLATVYEAFLDANYKIVEREQVMQATLDYQVYGVTADGKASIALKAHGGMFFLRKRSAAKCSPEEARAIDPDETGFDLIATQEDLVPQWRAA